MKSTKFLIFIIATIALVAQGCKKPTAEQLLPAGVLVEAKHFTKEVLQAEDLQIVDIRPEKNYADGHLPNALHLWRKDFSDEKGIMFSKQDLEKSLGEKGLSSNKLLVFYDDRGSCEAARLWWILKVYGFENVKILNGGIERWKTEGKPVTADLTEVIPSNFSIEGTPKKDLYASKEDVQQFIDQNGFIIDTRTQREFSGSRQKKGALRAGHIPNAKLVNFVEANDFTSGGDKCFKSIEEIKEIYDQIGLKPETETLVYCHSGVRSAHTTFVLTQLLGMKNVKNYDGSWREWSADTTLAIVQDSTTVIFN